MCIPRLAFGSFPEMSQVIVVGADSDSCSKVTVPETLESPRTTATERNLGLECYRTQKNNVNPKATDQRHCSSSPHRCSTGFMKGPKGYLWMIE